MEITTTTQQPSTKRLGEDALRLKHPQIVEGTLRYDAVANKQKVTINTRDAHGIYDGNTREIATSDLHQCFWTEATKEGMDRAKRNAKAKAKRAAKRSDDNEIVVIIDETTDGGVSALAALLS